MSRIFQTRSKKARVSTGASQFIYWKSGQALPTDR